MHKKPRKPNLGRGFSPWSKPYRPTKPQKFYERDSVIEVKECGSYFTLTHEELKRYVDMGVDLYFESTGTVSYYDSYEVDTTITIKGNKVKVPNEHYETQLEQYEHDYEEWKKKSAEWKDKKKLYDDWTAECKKVAELNQLERLQKKYRAEGA